jgi:hypothetical protein
VIVTLAVDSGFKYMSVSRTPEGRAGALPVRPERTIGDLE